MAVQHARQRRRREFRARGIPAGCIGRAHTRLLGALSAASSGDGGRDSIVVMTAPLVWCCRPLNQTRTIVVYPVHGVCPTMVCSSIQCAISERARNIPGAETHYAVAA